VSLLIISLCLDSTKFKGFLLYIRLIIDDRLSWEELIVQVHVKRKIMPFVGVLHKIKHIIPIRSRLHI
jgi:hypothetical protein